MGSGISTWNRCYFLTAVFGLRLRSVLVAAAGPLSRGLEFPAVTEEVSKKEWLHSRPESVIEYTV